jgi:hypothetical protein
MDSKMPAVTRSASRRRAVAHGRNGATAPLLLRSRTQSAGVGRIAPWTTIDITSIQSERYLVLGVVTTGRSQNS